MPYVLYEYVLYALLAPALLARSTFPMACQQARHRATLHMASLP